MGVCLSCLGLARRESTSDPSDTHPLLNEPYPPNHYGAVGDNARSSPQVDPEEIKRQRDALERLCTSTSDKLIDVTQTTRSDEGRTAPPKVPTDYPRLFAEQFGGPLADPENEDDVDTLRNILRKQAKDLATWNKPSNLGSLSIQFDDLMGAQLPSVSSKGKLAVA
ncbi:uncharacterized protein PV09_08998 [Verruconis gallopava]|uniref:Late endosomal/lysosomal adaptor and MAPK and MTOR activator 1 n=1 Tax=Verruconis gallopava TaxID=253628 RepID=A0A0D1ZZ35_9PEZI|nr:uncharacterized protein PV09_08998 [Verruconis gallopava]KIV99339.1 hypothetical protein PV09_08998 [Verruconis gallopava]